MSTVTLVDFFKKKLNKRPCRFVNANKTIAMKRQSESRKKLSLPVLGKILKETVKGFMDDNVMGLSGSLAYATLFSIVPFFSLLVAIGGIFDVDLAGELYAVLEPVLGADVIKSLNSMLDNASKSDSTTFATILSLGISIFGATTIFAEIQGSLNTIWGVKAVPKKSWLKFILNRVLSFSVIIAFAFILLITFSISSVISSLSEQFMASYPDVAEWIVKITGALLNIFVTALIFTMIFKVLPDAKIKFKDVRIGAIVTTLLLLVGQWGISFYISVANVGTVYGTAAFMAILITWIYYSAIIIYIGAEFTEAWANEMGGKIIPDEYAVATRTIEVPNEPAGKPHTKK